MTKLPRAFSIFLLAWVVLFLVLDFFPIWHGPSFRYTGADPEREVLNLGLLTTMIYDPEVSNWPILSPFASLIFAFQAGFLGMLVAARSAWRWWTCADLHEVAAESKS